ncbi:MAG: DUF885 family protein [Planctomycetota bacterium]
MSIRPLAAIAAVSLVACHSFSPPPPTDVGLWPDAAGGTSSPPLAEVVEAHWNGFLETKPEFATEVGDPRFNGEVEDRSIIGREARVDALWRLERRVQDIPEDRLDRDDTLTRNLLLREIKAESDALTSGYDEWDPGRALDLLVELVTLPEVQPVATARQRDQLVARWTALADALRREREGLERAANRGRIASRASLERIEAICDRLLETPVVDNPLVAPASGGGRWVELPVDLPLAVLAEREYGDAARQLELRLVNRHLQRGEVRALGTKVLLPSTTDPLTPDERGRFLESVMVGVENEVLPALAQLRATISDDLLPRSRGDQRSGLVHLPNGRDLYASLLALGVGDGFADADAFERTADDVDALRRAVVARGASLLGSETLAGLRDALRRDERTAVRDEDAVHAALEASAREMRLELPSKFGTVPAAGYVLEPIFPALSPGVDAFTYVPGDERGAAHVYFDAARLATRSVVELRALALRELLPGRHFFAATARENAELPRFRRHDDDAVTNVGFGLYALAIGTDLGYVRSDTQRLGADLVRLEAAALAAMDYAVHHDGWSRKQALEYLVQNVPHEQQDLAVELDLVLTRPGRAFATWLTAKEFERMYLAERDLAGAAFDPAAYQRRISSFGPVPASYLTRAAAR